MAISLANNWFRPNLVRGGGGVYKKDFMRFCVSDFEHSDTQMNPGFKDAFVESIFVEDREHLCF